MGKLKSDKMEVKGEQLSIFRLFLGGMILLIAYILSGCSVYTAIPVTLQELKHYVIEQEESYPQPLRPVVRAAVCSLRQLEFKVERIEISDNQAYIAAFWGKTRVRLEFVAVTPTLTRVESRMIQEGAWRDYASEEELFLSVRRTLDGESEGACRWQRAVRGMVPLFYQPESGASIVAYLTPGFSISISKAESLPPRWAAILLEIGGFAYLDKNTYTLKPILLENPTSEQPS
ncbi:MAG: hypothetical protein J7L25_12930 [Deltaproteobacteria bacterium]|nr:hypothetical protein [Candidatus Tharpella aukensis]